MTETTAVASVSTRENFKFGTVGRALPGVEIRIADDGEVLIKGPNIFQGYYRNEEATRETIVDGWLHTGDIGELDDEGYLKITGRKKDIIITAGGKNLTPANIENDLKQSPWISQAVMHGDRRPFPVALITLDEEEIVPWAKKQGLRDRPALAVEGTQGPGADPGRARPRQRQVRPGRADQEVHDPRPRPLPGIGRADADPQGQAQRREREVRGAVRLALPEVGARMSGRCAEPPDALVLGVGGVLGEAWMTGMLAGITSQTGIDFRECEYMIGTSAGSIVGAHLAAGEAPRSPSATGSRGHAGARWHAGARDRAERGSAWPAIARRAAALGMAAGAPFAPFALSATAPGGALARAALLARSPSGRFDLDGLGERIDGLGARFDGRLRVVAVDRARGRRVVFGEPASPDASGGGGCRGVLRRAGNIQADHDRRPHLRRRWGVESDQPRPGAGRPRDAGAVPDADRRRSARCAR